MNEEQGTFKAIFRQVSWRPRVFSIQYDRKCKVHHTRVKLLRAAGCVRMRYESEVCKICQSELQKTPGLAMAERNDKVITWP